jgi:preprotein translocase subunit Sec61beta
MDMDIASGLDPPVAVAVAVAVAVVVAAAGETTEEAIDN